MLIWWLCAIIVFMKLLSAVYWAKELLQVCPRLIRVSAPYLLSLGFEGSFKNYCSRTVGPGQCCHDSYPVKFNWCRDSLISLCDLNSFSKLNPIWQALNFMSISMWPSFVLLLVSLINSFVPFDCLIWLFTNVKKCN